MGAAVSSLHIVCAIPSSSRGGLLTLFPCSSVRSLSQETVLHKFLQREFSPWAAALHELPQRGSLPWATGGDLLHRYPPWAAGAQPWWPWSSPRAVGESLLWCLEYLIPLLHWPWCLQSCFDSSPHWSSSLSSTATQKQQRCPGHLPAQAHHHDCYQNVPRHSRVRW